MHSFCSFQIKGSSSNSSSSLSSSQTTLDLFHTNKWEHGGQDSVNPHEGVRVVLGSRRSAPGLFKVLTSFSIEEFDEICHIVCPTISAHTQSTSKIRVLPGLPSKLITEQRLLGFLLYMKHDPTTPLLGFLWNWCKSSVIDD